MGAVPKRFCITRQLVGTSEPAQAEYPAYVFGHGGVAAKFASEAFGQHGLGKVVFSRAEAACGDYQL